MFGFFKRAKDHRHYLTKGEKYLAAERYADARVEFTEALNCCPADAAQDQETIRKGLNAAGNRLAELNLAEGEHCVRNGDVEKAFDHFTLACDLAQDEELKANARAQLRSAQTAAKPAPKVEQEKPHGHGHAHGHAHGGGCGGCGGGHHDHDQEVEVPHMNLADEERFHLLIQPLPGDLPERYAAMGDEFAEAYLLIHDGDDPKAFEILKRLMANNENDIVIYELALIMYRNGQVHECDRLLARALQLNATNPAVHFGKVHLLADTGRLAEAIAAINTMLELDIQAESALLMLGDLQQAAGDVTTAIDTWSKSLQNPAMAKSAAERLVSVLNSQGRTEEAKFLAKQYLKGCC
ncbi:tetratricopeptide repeat protein [Geomonas sp.]|uniref:tetratricopeptide repeat protein n=1 Tax=Geomonas sp. TaxID=2651584 RepID=UPI002B486D12|nr:tetratricopeptide repeat protein [Geomonas sp.]HJV33985.1 tetratricopeptide repeat protein [Geomonas sp.]